MANLAATMAAPALLLLMSIAAPDGDCLRLDPDAECCAVHGLPTEAGVVTVHDSSTPPQMWNCNQPAPDKNDKFKACVAGQETGRTGCVNDGHASAQCVVKEVKEEQVTYNQCYKTSHNKTCQPKKLDGETCSEPVPVE